MIIATFTLTTEKAVTKLNRNAFDRSKAKFVVQLTIFEYESVDMS